MEEERKKARLKWWQDMAVLNLGTLLVALGVYFFKFTNNFTTGGVSGISIVMSRLIPGLSTAMLNLVLNLVLLALGLVLIGRSFSLRTAYAAVVSSLATLVLEKACPLSQPLTDQPFLELIFAVGLPAVGTALLFNVGASSGGTDILAMLLKKYTRLNIGTALVFVDCAVAVAACFVFDIRTGLYSILGLLLKAYLVDYVMENLHTYKVFHIMKALNHSATVLKAEGSYTHNAKTMLMTVVNRSQALKLQRFVGQTDPHCFMTVTTTSHIIGKGFRGMSE